MELNFLNANNKKIKYQATIQKSGKLNFNIYSNKLIGFPEKKFFNVALDIETNKFKSIFIVPSIDESDICAKVYKTGNYYFLNLKEIFDMIKLDYKSKAILFEIKKIDYYAAECFQLTRLDIKSKKKTSSVPSTKNNSKKLNKK